MSSTSYMSASGISYSTLQYEDQGGNRLVDLEAEACNPIAMEIGTGHMLD